MSVKSMNFFEYPGVNGPSDLIPVADSGGAVSAPITTQHAADAETPHSYADLSTELRRQQYLELKALKTPNPTAEEKEQFIRRTLELYSKVRGFEFLQYDWDVFSNGFKEDGVVRPSFSRRREEYVQLRDGRSVFSPGSPLMDNLDRPTGATVGLTIDSLYIRALNLYKQWHDEDRTAQKIRKYPLLSLAKPKADAPKAVKPEESVPESCLNGPFETYTAWAQGKRGSMEDTHIAFDFQITIEGQPQNIQCWAVFDGHGGNCVSDYLKNHFPFFVRREFADLPSLKETEIYTVIKRIFTTANEPVLRTSPGVKEGSTAIVAFKVNNALWIANTGDSRAVLCRETGAVQLSRDANPWLSPFEEQIASRGGSVLLNGYVQSNYGGVATARAFGDSACPSITASPQVTVMDIEASDRLILACDGLWDVVASQEVTGEESLVAKVDRLKTTAFERGTTDNVTIMGISFAPQAE